MLFFVSIKEVNVYIVRCFQMIHFPQIPLTHLYLVFHKKGHWQTAL